MQPGRPHHKSSLNTVVGPVPTISCENRRGGVYARPAAEPEPLFWHTDEYCRELNKNQKLKTENSYLTVSPR